MILRRQAALGYPMFPSHLVIVSSLRGVLSRDSCLQPDTRNFQGTAGHVFCKYHTSNDVFPRCKTGKGYDELLQHDNKMRIWTRSGKTKIMYEWVTKHNANANDDMYACVTLHYTNVNDIIHACEALHTCTLGQDVCAIHLIHMVIHVCAVSSP